MYVYIYVYIYVHVEKGMHTLINLYYMWYKVYMYEMKENNLMCVSFFMHIM